MQTTYPLWEAQKLIGKKKKKVTWDLLRFSLKINKTMMQALFPSVTASIKLRQIGRTGRNMKECSSHDREKCPTIPLPGNSCKGTKNGRVLEERILKASNPSQVLPTSFCTSTITDFLFLQFRYYFHIQHVLLQNSWMWSKQHRSRIPAFSAAVRNLFHTQLIEAKWWNSSVPCTQPLFSSTSKKNVIKKC